MDPVTHVLFGYLLGSAAFGESGALVGFATFMAFFPDLDTVSWFFPRRFARLRHRGVTHSLVVGAAASAILGAGVAAAYGVAWPLAFAAGFVGFISHVGLDYLNWGCMILWPWRRRGVEFTVQMGLAGPLVASTVGFAFILMGDAIGARREAMLLVGGAWGAYLVAKLLLKIRLIARHGVGAGVYPTPDPTRWRVIVTRDDGEHRETRYAEAAFRPRLAERVLFASRHRVTPPALPLKNVDDVAAFTFQTPEVQSLAALETPLAVEVEPAGPDAWVAKWYAVGWHSRGACFGALVSVSANGAYEAKKGRIPFAPRAERSVSA